MNNINLFLKKLGINYKNIDIYIEALTHPSFNNEFSYSKNYQRLEFLGDAILQKNVTVFLFNNYKNASEGKMSLIRSKFVKNKTLSNLSKKLNFNKYIRFGKSINKISDSIFGDVFEAIIGALYIDKGNNEVNKFLKIHLFQKIKKLEINDIKDSKTLLQEYLQSNSTSDICYIVKSSKEGFKASIFHNNNLFGIGVGKTKKKAELAAALNALNRLGKKNEID